MDIFEKEERKKETERNRAHQLRLATLAVAGVLATFTVALLGARDYFPPTYYTIIFILLVIISLVLIFGLYSSLIIQKVKSYSEKRKHDRLAKSYFEQFKKLVVRFKEFTENRDDNIQSVMHYIKNNTPAPNPFSQVNVVQPMFFQERYGYYMERLNQFNGTKDSLVALTKEFESILYMYDMLYIKEPVQKIRSIEGMTIEGNNVPKQYKESYGKARQKYIDFIMDYKKFAKDGNDVFKEKEDSGFLGSGIIFRDFFEQPDEL
ncbi:MAG: hypothetical protein A2W22_01860 [Candidatus Levybacteria bacterium RBG_16_35_11]|nr:MAG: hypothetical protein A2W22_01860 [Candidatus Levybacteria bacterium RBG_16_35_11]